VTWFSKVLTDQLQMYSSICMKCDQSPADTFRARKYHHLHSQPMSTTESSIRSTQTTILLHVITVIHRVWLVQCWTWPFLRAGSRLDDSAITTSFNISIYKAHNSDRNVGDRVYAMSHLSAEACTQWFGLQQQQIPTDAARVPHW